MQTNAKQMQKSSNMCNIVSLYINTVTGEAKGYMYQESYTYIIGGIAQPAGVLYNRGVSSLKAVSEQLAKTLITLEPHGIFDKILYAYAFQHCLTIGMHNSLFLMDKALLSINYKFVVSYKKFEDA